MRTLFAVLCALLMTASYAGNKEIAITIDDLPLVASRMNTPGNQQRSTERFSKIVDALKEYKVPAIGFVIGGAIEKGQWAFLEQFRNAGLMLGNHTYTHRSLNQIGAEKYIADIARAEKVLAPMITEPKYFRYPYLAEGNSKSKPIVLAYLKANHYTVAPVTIDSKDFQFNEQLYKVPFRAREAYVYKVMPRYLAYILDQTKKAEKRANGQDVKQILLIHANLLNSYALPAILEMYQKNGYKFISLTDALKNPAEIITSPVIQGDAGKSIQEQFMSF
ncbi:MAG: polysaccharide deacetylase family protein [Legionellales bacterium]|nr:polysaccharide deacetylase family protein [Legionellales bacterium]